MLSRIRFLQHGLISWPKVSSLFKKDDERDKQNCRPISLKLNLLKSLYFLPTTERIQFYNKVILPSITYGLLIWGSCGKTLFDELERIHARAAKIIHSLELQTPKEVVLRETNWKILTELHSQRLLFFVFHSYHGYYPESLEAMFIKYANKNDYFVA